MPDKNQQIQDNGQPAGQPPSPTGASGLGLLAEVTNLAWNLVIPIVGGVLLGHYLDSRRGDGITWTLSLLTLGVMVAFINLYELHIEHKPPKKENNLPENHNPDLTDEEK